MLAQVKRIDHFAEQSRESGTISGSTFSNNQATEGYGGAIDVTAEAMLVENSTFYSNTAIEYTPEAYGGYGGAIANWEVITINNSTFVSNTATINGSTIYDEGSELHLSNNLIAGSDSTFQCFVGTLNTNTNNFIQDGSCSLALTGDPVLSDLGDYGGQTSTFALLPGSPAIDAGDAATCTATDQRGEARVGTCDIGAFESQGFSLTYGSGGDQSTEINTTFAQPLTLTVTANVITEPVTGGEISFSTPDSGAGLTTSSFTQTIPNGGVVSTSVTANSQAGSYVVTATATGDTTGPVAFNLTNVVVPVDLTLSKSVTPTTALPGEIITYTLTFTNDSSATATDVVITDDLPISLTIQSVISSSSGTITRTSSSDTEMFELSELPAGQSGLITLTAVLSSDLPVNTIITNNAAISSNATDSNSADNSATVDLTIGNAAPELAFIADQVISESVELTLTMTASDSNGDSLTYGLSEAPAGAALDSASGEFTWTPAEADGPGLFTITVVVSDSYGLTDSRSFQVTVNEMESAPVFSFVDTHTIPETELFTLTLTTVDADVPVQDLTLNLLDLPTGSVFSSATGLFTWTPTELQGGSSYTMTALVTDTTGLTGSQQLVLSVTKENSAPTLATITASQIITELTTLSFTAVATDTDTPAQSLTFTLVALPLLNTPTGAVIDGDTGVFTWTPDESQGPGVYYTVVMVSDEEGASDSQLVMIVVTEDNTGAVLDPLTSAHTIDESETLTFTATATDSDLQDIYFGLEDEPDGASIDIHNGLFSWTPTEAQGPGVYPLTIIVSDDVLTDSETISITVAEVNNVPQFTSSPVTSTTVEVEYSYTITATDEGEMVSSGELTITVITVPDWLSLTDNGDGTALLNGTPDSSDEGDHQVGLQVSDGIHVETQSFTITVEAKEEDGSTVYLPLVVRN